MDRYSTTTLITVMTLMMAMTLIICFVRFQNAVCSATRSRGSEDGTGADPDEVTAAGG
jgi:hypothetical protein